MTLLSTPGAPPPRAPAPGAPPTASRPGYTGRSHLAFVDVLASCASTRHHRWKPTFAGLLTMRAVDRRVGARPVGQGSWDERRPAALGGARRAIRAIGAGAPVRAILSAVIEALATTPPVDRRVLLESLANYGRALEFDAEWTLAIDVHETVLALGEGRTDDPSSGQAAMRLGYALRMLARHRDAERWYEHAGRLAAASGDLTTRMLSNVGIAKVAMARGNYARARALLTATVQEAELAENRFARSSALHELSDLAYRNGQYDHALKLLHDALPGYQYPLDRHRALNDMAVNFAELGLLGAARDAYLVVAASAQEQTMRWVAMSNLLEMAGRLGDRAGIEGYRRQLAAAALPPALEYTFCSQLGLAYAHLPDAQRAAAAFTAALRVAEAHRMYGRVFEMEEALAALESRVRPIHRAPPPMPAGVDEITDVIRRMREAACGAC